MKLQERTARFRRQLSVYLYYTMRIVEPARWQLFAALAVAAICIGIIAIKEPFSMASTTGALAKPEYRKHSTVSPFIEERLLTPAEYAMLVGFLDTMDSLRQYDAATYEYILEGHEGLVDSVSFVITLYEQGQ
jgi:hypothetical protein